MKIISGIPSYNIVQKAKNINQRQMNLKLASPLRYDTVCFKSRDFLDLSEREIFKKIEQSIVPENFLGQGTEAEVYRIKDTDYCIRIPYSASNSYKFDFTRELLPEDKVNHVVAKLGFGTSIMKYFDGELPNWYRRNEFRRHNLQSEIAQMPVKSYTELLHQIADAVDNDMVYDCTGGNLIVNTKEQKLTAIDFYKPNVDEMRSVYPLREMYSVLTCHGSEEHTGKQIFDKIVSAAIEEFQPGKVPCMDLELFDFVELCLKRCHNAYTKDYDKIVQNINIQTRLLKQIKKTEIIDKSKGLLLQENINKTLQLLNHIK